MQKTKVECISSADKCLSWQIQGIRLERGGKLDWWFIDRGYGRSQNKATIWITRKNQIKRCGHFSKRNNEFVSMQDGRNIARMTAVILPLPTSGKNSSNNLQQKEKPEIPVQILKSDKISGVFWEITHVGIMLLRWRSSRVPKDDIPILLNYIPEDDCPMFDLLGCSETNKNKLWCFQEATIDDYWHIDGDKSLSEPWISVTRFALLNKNLPEEYMCVQGGLTKKQVTTRRGTVRPEESSNMSKGSQRTAINQWLKKSQSWTRQENNEAFTAFRTILIMKKS